MPPLKLSEWRGRTFSLSAILALGTCLIVSKVATVALELEERGLIPWLEPPPALEQPALTSNLMTTLGGEGFVPWPSVLPEPAAGPEGGNDMISANGGNDGRAFDPSVLTEGQTLALQQLAARRQALDEREQLLDMRAELNGRTESRLDEQIKRLGEMKTRLETLVSDLDEAEERKLARLVKIYETMKPKAAAEIFNRLEIPILIHVVERMKEVKSAAVLGKMDPAIARRVTTELARRKERPTLDAPQLDSGA